MIRTRFILFSAALAAFALAYSPASRAVLSIRPLPTAELPEQMCMLEHYAAHGGVLSRCSATVVSADQLMTARHCQTTEPKETPKTRALDPRSDLAIVRVDRDLGIPPMPLPRTASERDELLASNQCVLAGSGSTRTSPACSPRAARWSTGARGRRRWLTRMSRLCRGPVRAGSSCASSPGRGSTSATRAAASTAAGPRAAGCSWASTR